MTEGALPYLDSASHPPGEAVTMDIVLEVIDTFLGDHIYAKLLPAEVLQNEFGPVSNPTDERPSPPWSYEPATAYLHLEPSKAAYMSSWPRDNIYRQAASLFLITWCVQHWKAGIRRLFFKACMFANIHAGSSDSSSTSYSPPYPLCLFSTKEP